MFSSVEIINSFTYFQYKYYLYFFSITCMNIYSFFILIFSLPILDVFLPWKQKFHDKLQIHPSLSSLVLNKMIIFKIKESKVYTLQASSWRFSSATSFYRESPWWPPCTLWLRYVPFPMSLEYGVYTSIITFTVLCLLLYITVCHSLSLACCWLGLSHLLIYC